MRFLLKKIVYRKNVGICESRFKPVTWQLSTKLRTVLFIFWKSSERDTQGELEFKGYQNITLCGARF